MTPGILTKIALSAFIIGGLSMTEKAFSQADKRDQKKTTIRIKVTEDKDGKSKTIEKNYELPDLSGGEREDFVDKALDSLKIDPKSEREVTITVEDGQGNRSSQKRKTKNKSKSEHDDVFAYNFNDNMKDLNFNFDELRDKTRSLERELRPKAKIMMRDMENFGNRVGEFWNNDIAKTSTVRELSAYPNNPDNRVLNLRFFAPQKGDVNIIISDTKGKEVGHKEIKDFSGDFVGQIDIKKNAKGTLFVTVTQNEDGAVKRIIMP